uniref:Uncharacterized protein n=1 Tax=Ciona savignyi TaxID=51511 RepID=H2ZPM2_CIOSA
MSGTQSDANLLPNKDESTFKSKTYESEESTTSTTTITGGESVKNDAQGITPPPGVNVEGFGAVPLPYGEPEISQYTRGGLQSSVATQRYGPLGTSKVVRSEFNITGSKINNTVIGGNAPITLKSFKQVYKQGAHKEDIKISGGVFTNAVIGGKGVFNNQDANFTGSDVPNLQSTKAGEAMDGRYFFTPEQAVLQVLQTGIEGIELMQLLEKNYNVLQLANMLPKNERKRRILVNALLQMADVQEEQMDTC